MRAYRRTNLAFGLRPMMLPPHGLKTPMGTRFHSRNPRRIDHFDLVLETFGRGGTMRKYHHIGIPTTEERPGEVHLPHLKIFVSGYGKSLYNIEWTRYEADAPYPEIVKT